MKLCLYAGDMNFMRKYEKNVEIQKEKLSLFRKQNGENSFF